MTSRGGDVRAGQVGLTVTRTIQTASTRISTSRTICARSGEVQSRDRPALGLRRHLRGEVAHTSCARLDQLDLGCRDGRAAHPLPSPRLPAAVRLPAGDFGSPPQSTRTGGSTSSRARAAAAGTRRANSILVEGRRGPSSQLTTIGDSATTPTSCLRAWMDRATRAHLRERGRLPRSTASRSRTWARCGCTTTTSARTSGCPPPACRGSSTLFGRDSLIVSLQNMMVHPGFARGALQTPGRAPGDRDRRLARRRAGQDPARAARRRAGPLQRRSRTRPTTAPPTPPPLYLIVLHEAWKWLGDEQLLAASTATSPMRCLEWIDRYGDLDGDGFQEYQTRSPQGYENMGWKDAGDAVVYPDGSQVQPAQGALRAAGLRLRRLAADGRGLRRAGRAGAGRRAARARRPSSSGASRTRFWCEDIGLLRLRPRPGQAADRDRRLERRPLPLERDRRPGPRRAGRRAASSSPTCGAAGASARCRRGNPAYNPFSYQLRLGLAARQRDHRAGLQALRLRRRGGRVVARDIFEAASYFAELPTAGALRRARAASRAASRCSTSARTSRRPGRPASIFQLLQAILGLRADAPHGRLYVDPTLPRWLPDVTLRGLRVGPSAVDLRFWREGERSRWDVLALTGDIQVAEQRWSAEQAPLADGAEVNPAKSDA